MAFQFSDELIVEIAKSLQLSILTGTDIVDHLRMFFVQPSEEDGRLVLTSECEKIFAQQIQSLLEKVKELESDESSA